MSSVKLKKKLKLLSDNISENHNIRLHRAISWMKCSEDQSDNLDLQFLSLWISYNSCYSIDDNLDTYFKERTQFNDFINKLVELDGEKRFFTLLWHKFSGPVRLLIANEYLFKPFWQYQRGNVVNWEKLHLKSIEDANKYLAAEKTAELLKVVLDRLYVLRNQLIHGGSTYKSKVNRMQLQDACNLLKLLVPIIINIMIDNHKENWGKIYYPVIK
jgi:hypothetical protein